VTATPCRNRKNAVFDLGQMAPPRR
jgi:hypothetical protein